MTDLATAARKAREWTAPRIPGNHVDTGNLVDYSRYMTETQNTTRPARRISNGIVFYWSETIGRYVTIPED